MSGANRSTAWDRMLGPIHRWVWSDPDRRIRKLLLFGEVETDGGRDILRAAEITPDPLLRRLYLEHAIDELHHGDLFRERGQALLRTRAGPAKTFFNGTPLPGGHGLDDLHVEDESDPRLLAFLHVAEKAAAGRFEIYRDCVADDPETRAIFEEILRDEVFHMNYSYAQLNRVSPETAGAACGPRAQAGSGSATCAPWPSSRRSSATSCSRASTSSCWGRSRGPPSAQSAGSLPAGRRFPAAAITRRRASTDMKILGISAHYHDAAAALVVDGVPVAAVQEERLSRRKHDASFPLSAIEWCLDRGGLEPEDLDAVVFYERSMLKFARILTSTLRAFPRSWRSFPMAMKNSLGEKIWARGIISSHLGIPRTKILFTRHHDAHAAAAFFPAPVRRAALLTADGVGEWATVTTGIGERRADAADLTLAARSAFHIRSACCTRRSRRTSASP